MPRYVFHMKVKEENLDRLRELNEDYRPALERAAAEVDGLNEVAKYLVGDEYVEVIDCEESFEEFGQTLAADPEVREFMKAVNGCFEHSLREMSDRQMDCIQRIGDGRY